MLVSSFLRLNRLRAKHASLDFPTTKRKRIYVSRFYSLYVKSRSVLRQSYFPGDSLLSKVWCQGLWLWVRSSRWREHRVSGFLS